MDSRITARATPQSCAKKGNMKAYRVVYSVPEATIAVGSGDTIEEARADARRDTERPAEGYSDSGRRLAGKETILRWNPVANRYVDAV